MKLHHILLVLTLICGSINAELGGDKYHRPGLLMGETEAEERCEATCEICFPSMETLKRMGCVEKCTEEGVDHFDCPEWQSFLNDVNKPSKRLQAEIEAFYAKRSYLLSKKDIEGFAAQLSENSVVIIDNQIPTVGRANRAKKIRDLLISNPVIVRQHFYPVKYGEKDGYIWVNGVITDYDSQNNYVSSLRFMSLLELVDEVLQEYLVVLFQ